MATDENPAKQAEPWMIFLVAAILFFVGIGFGYYRHSVVKKVAFLKENGTEVLGYVVGNNRSGDKGSYSYSYDVAYEYNGREYTYSTQYNTNAFNTDQVFPLLIDPQNPSNAIGNNDLETIKGSYLWTFILISLGGFIFWLGLKKVRENK